MKNESLTFDEILRRENFVFCDSSLTSLESNDWYWDGVYSANSFSGIDRNSEETQISSLRNFISFIQHPSVRTVEGVPEEIERGRIIVSDTIRFLSWHEGNSARKYRKKIPCVGFRASRIRRELLEEIRDLFHTCYLEAKRRVFVPRRKPEYDFLENVVLRVTEKTNAKINLEDIYEKKRIKQKKATDFHTDERMVASAIYLSIVENQGSVIMARDSDFGRILSNTLSYMSLRSARGLSRLSHVLRENPIKVYFATGYEEAYLKLNTSEIDSCVISGHNFSRSEAEWISYRVFQKRNPLESKL